MPFVSTWVPAPKNMSLTIHEERPGLMAYECRHCGGWIEGSPNSYRENTLAPLAGRKGRAEYCNRCGSEISFFGIMA